MLEWCLKFPTLTVIINYAVYLILLQRHLLIRCPIKISLRTDLTTWVQGVECNLIWSTRFSDYVFLVSTFHAELIVICTDYIYVLWTHATALWSFQNCYQSLSSPDCVIYYLLFTICKKMCIWNAASSVLPRAFKVQAASFY